MTTKDINQLKKKFAALMVPGARIFDEIMRAYYLDYHLFSHHEVAECGLTMEELYAQMNLTFDELGTYAGNAEQYAQVFTLAMQVNPMDFAPGVVKDGMDWQNFVADLIENLKSAGKNILLSGADGYLYRLPWIFYELQDKEITVILDDEVWRKKLSFLFPKSSIISFDELDNVSVSFDFIFHCEKKNLERISLLHRHMKDTGVMKALVAYDRLVDSAAEQESARQFVAKERVVTEYYDIVLCDDEWGLLDISHGPANSIDFGEARIEGEKVKKYKALSIPMEDFISCDDWNYDLYRYNASAALQTLLGTGMLSLEHTIASEYRAVSEVVVAEEKIKFIPSEAWEEDLGLRSDLIHDEMVKESISLKGVQKGDILLSCDEHKVHMAVVYDEGDHLFVSSSVIVLRPQSYYTGEYLKSYLEGPVGHLFMDIFNAGGYMILPLHRLLRIPLPKTDEEKVKEVTEKGKAAVELLAKAGENWRMVKRESIGLMMGK